MTIFDEPWGKVGDRSSRQQTDELRRVIAASVTGRNLLNGAQDVEYIFDSDPTGTVGTWPDGARGIAPDGLGDLLILRYTRATGWKRTTLS